LLQHEPDRRRRRRRVIVVAVLSALCAYMHYSGLVFVATVGALAIVFAGLGVRKQLPSCLAAAGVTLVLYAPWAPGLMEDLARGGLDFLDAPEASRLSVFPIVGVPPYVYLGCAALAAAGHAPLPKRSEQEPSAHGLRVDPTLFLSVCLVVVVLGFFIKSIVSEPIYSDKYLIVAWPPVFVLLGAAATRA